MDRLKRIQDQFMGMSDKRFNGRQLIVTFSNYFGSLTSLEVEARALLDGLKLVKDHAISEIQIELNSLMLGINSIADYFENAALLSKEFYMYNDVSLPKIAKGGKHEDWGRGRRSEGLREREGVVEAESEGKMVTDKLG
ncbi:hypothetical protein ACH5RR_013086 [Cinchona calisaya]|uniref:Uncharacterized protein n=1 Tax=Cinchona calisaya TaxID=153742 RepID=A0ABD2ZZ21_9GENT